MPLEWPNTCSRARTSAHVGENAETAMTHEWERLEPGPAWSYTIPSGDRPVVEPPERVMLRIALPAYRPIGSR